MKKVYDPHCVNVSKPSIISIESVIAPIDQKNKFFYCPQYEFNKCTAKYIYKRQGAGQKRQDIVAHFSRKPGETHIRECKYCFEQREKEVIAENNKFKDTIITIFDTHFRTGKPLIREKRLTEKITENPLFKEYKAIYVKHIKKIYDLWLDIKQNHEEYSGSKLPIIKQKNNSYVELTEVVFDLRIGKDRERLEEIIERNEEIYGFFIGTFEKKDLDNGNVRVRFKESPNIGMFNPNIKNEDILKLVFFCGAFKKSIKKINEKKYEVYLNSQNPRNVVSDYYVVIEDKK